MATSRYLRFFHDLAEENTAAILFQSVTGIILPTVEDILETNAYLRREIGEEFRTLYQRKIQEALDELRQNISFGTTEIPFLAAVFVKSLAPSATFLGGSGLTAMFAATVLFQMNEVEPFSGNALSPEEYLKYAFLAESDRLEIEDLVTVFETGYHPLLDRVQIVEKLIELI